MPWRKSICGLAVALVAGIAAAGDTKIEGDAIVVSSPAVPEPVAARYAWQSYPVATLYNGTGLPAVPFRTDGWPETTESHGLGQ